MMRRGGKVLVARRGFTLVELLAAMAVLAVLSAAVTRITGVALRVWDRGVAETRRTAAARAALDILRRDLRCAAAPGRPGACIIRAADEVGDGMTGDRLYIATASFAAEPSRRGAAEVCYYLDTCRSPLSGGGSRRVLKRAVRRAADGARAWDEAADRPWGLRCYARAAACPSAEGWEQQVLAGGITGIHFSCRRAAATEDPEASAVVVAVELETGAPQVARGNLRPSPVYRFRTAVALKGSLIRPAPNIIQMIY